MNFWDASALVALVLGQEGDEQLRGVLGANPSIGVWWGSRVEALSALCRIRRDRIINEVEQARAAKDIEDFLARAGEVEPTEELRNRACSLLRLYPLRAGDALQLAAALIWTNDRPAGTMFVCLDRRLRAAAENEGFLVAPEL